MGASLRHGVNGIRPRSVVSAHAKRFYDFGTAGRWPKGLGPPTIDKRTEFEHADDTLQMLLPKPGPSGFTRGSLIRWRCKPLTPTSSVSDPGLCIDYDSNSIDGVYDMMEQVGEGAFGTVHSAKHLPTGEIVAIKKINKNQVKETELLNLEVEFLKAADHPNVVRYYETLEDDDYLYLVMEMCSGGALSKHIKDAHSSGIGLTESEMARIMVQMLQGLAYCHAHAIVHRDVKPQNYLFGCGSPQAGRGSIPIACSGDTDASLKMVDFGISGVVHKKRFLTKRVGTDGFMAPEVLSDSVYGPSADIFSLGAVFHNMIVGRSPEWKKDKNEYAYPGSMRWRTLSPDGREFLKSLLCVNPADRPSASEAIQDPWFKKMGVIQSDQEVLEMCHQTQEVAASVLTFSRRSKLQRAIMYSMVAFAQTHNHHIEKLRILFLATDKGSTGGIRRPEFFALLRAWGMNDAYDMEVLFNTVNVAHTGSISYSEWLAASLPMEWYNAQDFRRAFDAIDSERKGYIRAGDLAHLLPSVFNTSEIELEIRCTWPLSDGRLYFRDFCFLTKVLDDTSRSWIPVARRW